MFLPPSTWSEGKQRQPFREVTPAPRLITAPQPLQRPARGDVYHFLWISLLLFAIGCCEILRFSFHLPFCFHLMFGSVVAYRPCLHCRTLQAQLVSERYGKVCSLTCREVPAGSCSTDIAGKREEMNLCFHALHRPKREDACRKGFAGLCLQPHWTTEILH